MKWYLPSVFSCAIVGAILLLPASAARGDESPAEPRLTRAKIVDNALRREANGAVEDRLDLLRPALAQGTGYDLAFWESGFVFDAKHKEWLTLSEVNAAAAGDSRLKDYNTVRKQHGDTIDGHLDVARWCLAKKLDDQAHAHLTRVLELDPNQPEARRMLGYRLDRGSWISSQETAESQAKTRKAANDLAKWKPKLEKLRGMMQSGSKGQKAQRLAMLEAIHDPAAVGAIDAVFCSRGGQDLQQGLSLLENLPSAESAAVLARYAVFAPWESVGKRAAQALRGQRKQDYVPLLLPGMQSPVFSRAEVYQEPGSGQSYYRQIFFRDGEEREVAVVDGNPNPQGNVQGNAPVAGPRQPFSQFQQARMAILMGARGMNTANNNSGASMGSGMSAVGAAPAQTAPAQAVPAQAAPAPSPPLAATLANSSTASLDDPGFRTLMLAAQRDQSSSAQNSSASRLNRRIAAVLTEATGEANLTTGADWWGWWYNENDCLPPIRAYRVSFTPDFPNQLPTPSGGMSEQEYKALRDGPPPPPPSRGHCECFAAGTIVWTEIGPVAVEKIKMGDRVFACDPDSGALALKVVLRPTIRPPSQLLKIRLDSEDIRSTGGHCFWVSGRGWVMARNLEPGMNVHTIRGTATVAGVKPDRTEAAYNLVVDGFHSYFAGRGKYLTHDNTIRRPTDRLVPGLAASR